MTFAARPFPVDPREIRFTFVRASGPGGQNVNKVSSAVQLRFDVRGSPSLAGPVKARLQRSLRDGRCGASCKRSNAVR